jgi:hypothetical protein
MVGVLKLGPQVGSWPVLAMWKLPTLEQPTVLVLSRYQGFNFFNLIVA